MSKNLYLGEAAPPGEKTCDWCDKPGVASFEISKPGKKFGTGQFLYPCARHVETAKRMVEELRTRKKAA
jgi:hypothetical protein